MLLIRQCNVQVLQLMLLRLSQATWVMRAGLLECIFDGGFLESRGKKGILDFWPGCQGCKSNLSVVGEPK